MDGVTFCGSCGAQMEFPISQTPETPQQNFPDDGVTTQQPSQQQSYQQQAQPPDQPYGGGQPGGYNTTPSGGPSSGGMVPPKNYMTESIVVTVISFLCCCSPISVILGIIAIIKANNVNSEFERRNINEAISNADSAKKLTIWAAVIAVAFYIIIMIFYFVFWAAMINESGGFENFWDSMS
jgi:hypothetical protein